MLQKSNKSYGTNYLLLCLRQKLSLDLVHAKYKWEKSRHDHRTDHHGVMH
jgi:hypothetical protein